MSPVEEPEVSDEEIAAIYAEVDGKKKPEEDIADPSKKAAEESESDDQKDDDAAQPSEEKEEAEGEAAEKTPEEKEADEKAQKDLSERAVKIGLPEAATQEEVEAKEKESQSVDKVYTSDEIQTYAVKHGMTFAEAESDLKATQAVLKNYKTPDELARALRSAQSGYDKLKNEKEKQAAPPMFKRMSEDQFIGEAKAHLAKDSQKHIDAFRAKYPSKSELLSDEAIIEELADRALSNYKVYADQQEQGLKSKAEQKREQSLTGWDKADERFIPEVKAVLSKTPDHIVLSDGFDVKDLLFHAMGQRYKADLKAHGEREFKRGQEKPTIAGALNGGSGASPNKSGGSVGSSLNKAQKERAEEMFPDVAPEKAHALFTETWSDELKKDKNFVE